MSSVDLATVGMMLFAWSIIGAAASFVWDAAVWLAAPLVLVFALGVFGFAVVLPVLLIYETVTGNTI